MARSKHLPLFPMQSVSVISSIVGLVLWSVLRPRYVLYMLPTPTLWISWSQEDPLPKHEPLPPSGPTLEESWCDDHWLLHHKPINPILGVWSYGGRCCVIRCGDKGAFNYADIISTRSMQTSYPRRLDLWWKALCHLVWRQRSPQLCWYHINNKHVNILS